MKDMLQPDGLNKTKLFDFSDFLGFLEIRRFRVAANFRVADATLKPNFGSNSDRFFLLETIFT